MGTRGRVPIWHIIKERKMIKNITSTENKLFKQTKKLLSRSERYKTKRYIAEGKRLVRDAVEAGCAEYIFVSEGYCGDIYAVQTYGLSEKMFAQISDTQTTQGIIAVCSMADYVISDDMGNLLLVSDRVSDPGNLGTLIRSAECAGAAGVVVLKGSVDPYCTKAVRSAMGSLFRIPIYFCDEDEFLKTAAEYSLVSTVLDGSVDLFDTEFPEKVAVVVGNEAHGISPRVASASDVRVRIPMCGGAESLNASVAGSVVLYEIYRQSQKR